MIESTGRVSSQGLLALIGTLAGVDPFVSDAERVDQLAALERVKGACAAAQAAVTAAFVASQEQEQAERRQERAALEEQGATSAASGARRGHLGRGIAGQVALARRESPARGSQHVKLALALVHEMPNTFAALTSGLLSEARAEIIARESAHLSGDQRTGLDAELVVIARLDATSTEDGDADDEAVDGAGQGVGVAGIGSLGDRELTRRVRALAYRADPAAAAERCAKAALERRVELRHAADAMCRLTAHLPLAQAVAAHAALTAAADTARAGGDLRRKGQVMADTLVERVTGQERADAVPVEVQLVITPESLFDAGDTPAQVPGYGTVPAAWARDFLTHDTDPDPDPDPDQPLVTPSARPGRHSSDPLGDADDEMLDAYGGLATGEDEFGSFLNSDDVSVFDRSDRSGRAGRAGRAGRVRVRDPEQRRRGGGTRPPTLQPPTGGSAATEWISDGAGSAGDGSAGDGSTEITQRARVWVRRLYAHPKTGQLVAMDSTRRVFDGNLRRFLISRDADTCRTPWCDAPIRHLDHIRDHARGGPTSALNGQGLCARCNHTKNEPGWNARTLMPASENLHTAVTSTPTGHSYRSTAPPLVPGVRVRPARPSVEAIPTAEPLSPFERYLTGLLVG